MFYLQAIDITDPNPIALLMLCVHLYQKIPQFLPKATVEFSGRLHTTVCRQVQYSPQVFKSTDQAVRVREIENLQVIFEVSFIISPFTPG